jgi:N-carbamoylputrescine amidase
LCPRATLAPSADKWLAGGRAAAVVSGAYCVSSNFTGPTAGDLDPWGGLGWIIEPEEGGVLATTSEDAPFRTIEIDRAVADAAKRTYPRYVRD